MDEDPNKTKKYKIIILGLLIHLLLLFAVFDVYFASPLDHGMPSTKSTDSPPAKRLVLFVADGLRAEAIFGEHHQERAPYLTNILKNYGSWGVVHTRVPTESRPGHVAMLAGIYEDPSAILKGWKSNPVHFDSVINQSINAWAWGSPDIINIFNKDHSSRVHLHAYGAEMEDFGQSDTSALDTWVFQKVVQFLHNNVLQCNNNCETYHSSGNLFFLHMLGIDTAGHGFKPHSEQYKSNIQLVDASIRDMVTQLETVYPDKSTAYVFTSDHGMTDWGSHGAGSLHETEAPIIAWGAGIKRNSGRQDINQIDIAPLLASLIGINIPTNSLGFLPTGYLDTDLGNLAKMVLSNTLQVFEIFNVKRARIRNTALVFLPFQDERHKSPEEEVQKLKLLLVRGKYKDLIAECERFRMHLIDGVTYYHNYYNYPVLVSVSAGFLMWITFLGLTISSQTKLTSPSTHRKTLLPTVLIITAGLLCYKSNFPPTYYLYFTFPIAMYFTTFPDGRISNTLLKISSSSSNLINMCFYLAGIELLVYGFFNRVAFTLVMILVGVWITSFANVTTSKREKIVWMSCCFVLAVFPALPVMKTTFNVPMYVVGYVGWVAIFAKMYLRELKAYHSMENILVDLRIFSVQFVVLQAATVYILALEYGFIQPDSSWKYLSWLMLILPIAIIPFTSKFIVLRLVATFFGFAPFYLLVSPNFEVLFSVFYVALLCTWLLVETRTFQFGASDSIIYYYKFEDYRSKNKITPAVFRRAFLFMVFIFLGFFGTGNVASLNSFDPMWVRAFLTVFSPFKMMGLILLKFSVPFIFSCSIFRAINAVGKENVLNTFCVILIFSDLMVLQFLYLITNEGSWLDIGTSLSHFVIVEGFVTILLLLYGVAHWLTSVSYKF